MINKNDILNANRYGLENADDIIFSQTPLLETAACLGQKGIDLSELKIVKGYRFGRANESGTSFNFREETREQGLSMARIENCEECYSSVYFADKKKFHYEGFLLNEKGTDGEALIIPFGEDFENYGF